MNCPACNKVLVSVTSGQVTVDVCQNGCGGVWFDQFEFKKIDEKHERDGDLITQMSSKRLGLVKASHQLKCPKCKDVTMMRRFESVKRQVEVDECARCAGFWLDAGELTVIREQFLSEAERVNAATKYFGEVFGGDLEKIKKSSKQGAEAAKRITRALRFICPSQYLPKAS